MQSRLTVVVRSAARGAARMFGLAIARFAGSRRDRPAISVWLAVAIISVCWASHCARADSCVDPGLPDHRFFAPDSLQALSQPDGALNLVAGDSIASRWPADDIAHWMGGPVQNLGVSGDTPRGLLWRLQQVQGPRRWRHILLIVGINSIRTEITCHDVATSIEADVHALHGLAPAAHIVVLAVMPLGPGLSGFVDQVDAIDVALARDARAGGFTLLDVNDGLLSACKGRASCPLLLDWLHPTLAGYRRIGAQVEAAFEHDPPEP